MLKSGLTVLILDRDAEGASMYAEYLQAKGISTVRHAEPDADLATADVVVYGTRSCGDHSSAVGIVRNGRPVPTIVISSDERDRGRPPTSGIHSIHIRPVDLDLLLEDIRRAAGGSASTRSDSSLASQA